MMQNTDVLATNVHENRGSERSRWHRRQCRHLSLDIPRRWDARIRTRATVRLNSVGQVISNGTSAVVKWRVDVESVKGGHLVILSLLAFD
jgi:hypothetical protein